MIKNFAPPLVFSGESAPEVAFVCGPRRGSARKNHAPFSRCFFKQFKVVDAGVKGKKRDGEDRFPAGRVPAARICGQSERAASVLSHLLARAYSTRQLSSIMLTSCRWACYGVAPFSTRTRSFCLGAPRERATLEKRPLASLPAQSRAAISAALF